MGSGSLPTGTVTFLMTDVEGSTPLWEADAAAMSEAMGRHDEIIERAVTSAVGVVVKPRGEGDSRFCVFASAPAAVTAALEIQRAMPDAEWPTAEPIKVRIALYTGHAGVRDPEYGEYYGTAPNRCARLRDLGHGGQILISASTASLVAEQLPDKAELIALGAYRLRGIELPEPVHQLTHPDLRLEFPPVRAGAAGNLPVPFTSFVGREHEIEELTELLESQRLLTLSGAAGVGKTRLAIEVARSVSARFPDGVWLCELAPVRDLDAVPRALIGVFGLTEEQERSVGQILADYVRHKRLLVLLDNCEHLISGCADVCTQLLTVSPACSVIATSREPLGAEGEANWRVPSLALPEKADATAQDLAACESVALFCQRALSSEPAFALDERTAPSVARICRRLDGIPLAIELAAGKLGVLDVSEIAAGVEDSFALLTGGPRTALERQQTMRAAVDWSYSLLLDDERATLRRLGVFVGGFSIHAAREVCRAEGQDVDALVASLVRKSLLAKDPERPGRYLLLETIRAYAAEKLDDEGEGQDARERHLRFFCGLGVRAAEPLEGGPDQQDWLERLAADNQNLQAAVSLAASVDPDAGMRLCVDIASYWRVRGHWRVGRTALEPLLAATADRSTIARARALRAASEFAINNGDYGVARTWLDESLTIVRKLGDPREIAQGIGQLGWIAHEQGEYVEARAQYERSLSIAREFGDRSQLARTLGSLGFVAYMQDDYETARTHYERSLAIARELGHRSAIVTALDGLGAIAHIQGDYETARADLEESVAIARELGSSSQVTWGVGRLGLIAHLQGDHETASAYLRESMAIARELGNRSLMAWVLGRLGEAAYAEGDYETACEHWGETLAIARALGHRSQIAWALDGLGVIAHVGGDYETARAHWEESLAIARELAERNRICAALYGLGSIAHAQGDYGTVRALWNESLSIARDPGDPRWIARFLRGFSALAQMSGAHDRACALAAAADAARERLGFRLEAFDEARFNQTVELLRDAMDPNAWEVAWALGRAMSLEEAIDLALTI